MEGRGVGTRVFLTCVFVSFLHSRVYAVRRSIGPVARLKRRAGDREVVVGDGRRVLEMTSAL